MQSSYAPKERKMQKKLKVVVIGLGKIAQMKHIPNILAHPDLEIVGLCDISHYLLGKVGLKFNIPHKMLYTQIESLLTLGTDLAFVLTHNHYPIAKRLLEHRVGVFTEKPMVWKSSEADQLIEIAEEHSVGLWTGYMRRRDPYSQWVKHFIEQSGPPLLINCRHYGGGIKKWTDSLNDIVRPGKSEKKSIRHKLEIEWKQSLTPSIIASRETIDNRIQFHRLMLELVSHNFDLMMNWFGRKTRIDKVQVYRRKHNDATVLWVELQICYGKTPVHFEVVPLFNAPWPWKETIDLIYPADMVSISFGNPFFGESDTFILHDGVKENGFHSNRIHLTKRDAFAFELDWIISEAKKTVFNLDSVRDAAAVLRLIERCVSDFQLISE